MRSSLLSVPLVLALAGASMGCSGKHSNLSKSAVAPTPSSTSDKEKPIASPDAVNPLLTIDSTKPGAKTNTDDPIPRVIRRLISEEKDLVSRSLTLANDLPDPHGRQRALTEANALSVELSEIEAPLDGASSDTLDNIVVRLLRIDTRVALLHEALRTATNHSTAVVHD